MLKQLFAVTSKYIVYINFATNNTNCILVNYRQPSIRIKTDKYKRTFGRIVWPLKHREYAFISDT